MEAEWKWIRSDVSGGWKGTSQGAGRREEEGQEGSRTMTYHDTQQVAPRRRIEKKTTSQSSAKALSYTTGAVRLSTGPLPIN